VEFPYITTVWDLQHRLQPFFPEVSCDGRWEFRESVFGTSLRRATYVLTGTEAGKAEIERFYQVPAERIRIVPLPTPGFALDSASSDVTTVLAKYCIRGQYVFYPAQFWPHKNHVGVLRAIQILKEKHDLDFSAVFVGADHGNLEHVKGLAQKLGISDRAYFLRFVSREELVALYRGALCLVYVSYFGPDNLPPLEAFALGCPVLASAVNGSREQLGDAALLVDPADHDAIAGGINRLQKEPSLRSVLVEQGFARARRFTGSDFVRKVFELLNEFEAVRSCWPSGGYRPISP
jgi:glycosyltransferase involved in cell wall biosynthesis